MNQMMDSRCKKFLIALSVLLTDLPTSSARGGKGAKGAGGGATAYGHRGLHNAAAYEITWEDMVLGAQLSAMCFGALIALCIVACCAYKICGPAEEEDWSRRYRSSFKVSRLPPEILREIYTVPTNTGMASVSQMNEKMQGESAPLTPPPPGNPTLQKYNINDTSMMGTAVSADDHSRLIGPMAHQLLPNGRVFMDDHGKGCLSLGNVLEHRNRGVSALSTSRLLNDARRPGVAPRLAAHLNNSTLDLTHPHSVIMSNISASSRSLLEQKSAVV